jgi:hypothetical protein
MSEPDAPSRFSQELSPFLENPKNDPFPGILQISGPFCLTTTDARSQSLSVTTRPKALLLARSAPLACRGLVRGRYIALVRLSTVLEFAQVDWIFLSSELSPTLLLACYDGPVI